MAMKTRKRILVAVWWQHQYMWQWIIALTVSLLVWFEDRLGALAATTHFHDRMEDVRWLWRDRTLHLGTLAMITVVVILGLILMARIQRRHHLA